MVLDGVLCVGLVSTCNEAMFVARLFSSSPLKLRLLYRLAASNPPERMTWVSSALLALLCPGLMGGDTSELTVNESAITCDGPKAGVPADVERWVGVEAPVGMLVDESVLPAPRLYRPGDGLTGASPKESERSGIEVDSVIAGDKLSIGFLMSLSSFDTSGGPARERLEDPDVDTVESEEDEGCEGWPSRA